MVDPLTILTGDCRDVLPTLPSESVQCCVTSPPYFGLRDYGVEGQIGLESSVEEYVSELVSVFGEVRRALRPDGVLWLNLGDSYAGSWGAQGHRETPATISRNQIRNHPKRASHTGAIRAAGLKPKDLIGIPWRVAFALQADGWWLRSDVIWSKPNPMPESVADRPTKAHEYLFLLTKGERYFYDADAIAEPSVSEHPSGNGFARPQQLSRGGRGSDEQWTPTATRNARSVWTIPTKPYSEAHFATFPPELARRCILAGSRPGDTVLDPFNGAGTTGLVAHEHQRKYIGIEINPEYVKISKRRTEQRDLLTMGA